jgi:multiple sugar transport system substrate-binding protein
MKRINRRHFLSVTGTLATGAILAACGDNTATPGVTTASATTAASTTAASATTAAASTAAGTTAAGTTAAGAATTAAATTAASATTAAAAPTMPTGAVNLRWWDHYAPLEKVHNDIFANFSKQYSNVKVEHTIYNLPQLGQSLQLAFNSKQAPDVHAIASLNVPTAQLVANNWFVPLDGLVSADFIKRFPEGILLEGLHTFGGKLYSFPLFGFRSSSTLLWFDKQLMADVGGDPENGPKTWEDFRDIASKMTKKGNGQTYGWIQAIQLADRLGTQTTELAMRAGATIGQAGINYKTGEYAFHTDGYVQAIEFMLALQKDGSLFPASTSLDARTARARFAAGAGGMNFDGPWSIGVINSTYKDFLPKVNVGQIPAPKGKETNFTFKGPNGGDFWINSQSKNAVVGAKILEQFNTDDYYAKLAEGMDQPPLNLAAVDKANVHPSYKKAMKLFQEGVLLEPSPLVKNPEVAQVQAEMKDIRPNLGEIVQGALSGTVSDWKGALKGLSDKLTAERDRAIKVVQGKGVKVSVDDWIFANWDTTKDYDSTFYKK